MFGKGLKNMCEKRSQALILTLFPNFATTIFPFSHNDFLKKNFLLAGHHKHGLICKKVKAA